MSTAKTLELPPALGETLRREAARAGLSYEEEAALLLYLGTSLMDGPGDTPFGDAVKETLAASGVDPEALGAVLRDIVRRCASADSGLRASPWDASEVAERVSAFGKYAGMTSGSEELALRKQPEHDL